jgi:voltage-gated potassium channel
VENPTAAVPDQPQPPAAGPTTSTRTGALQLSDLSPRHRRRALVRALVGVLIIDAVLLGLYSILPATGLQLRPIPEFLLVLGFFILVLATQIRAISRSRLPTVRAATTLALVIPLFFILCSLFYLVMEAGNADSFTQPIDRVSALYFTITVFSTVGFGDIAAKTDAARVAVSVQMILDLILIGAVVQLILSVAKDSLARPAAAEPDAPR